MACHSKEEEIHVIIALKCRWYWMKLQEKCRLGCMSLLALRKQCHKWKQMNRNRMNGSSCQSCDLPVPQSWRRVVLCCYSVGRNVCHQWSVYLTVRPAPHLQGVSRSPPSSQHLFIWKKTHGVKWMFHEERLLWNSWVQKLTECLAKDLQKSCQI